MKRPGGLYRVISLNSSPERGQFLGWSANSLITPLRLGLGSNLGHRSPHRASLLLGFPARLQQSAAVGGVSRCFTVARRRMMCACDYMLGYDDSGAWFGKYTLRHHLRLRVTLRCGKDGKLGNPPLPLARLPLGSASVTAVLDPFCGVSAVPHTMPSLVNPDTHLPGIVHVHPAICTHVSSLSNRPARQSSYRSRCQPRSIAHTHPLSSPHLG